MSIRRISFFLLVTTAFVVTAAIPTNPNDVQLYTISGTVYYDGSSLEGVVLYGFPGEVVDTDGTGFYSATVPSTWSGTVSPTLPGYAFDPYSRDYSEGVASNQFDQNYTAHTAHIIVGRNVNMVPYPLTYPNSNELMPNTGDPYLQRQNEPSLAVSTRNPMHLFAGANDYRTVDVPVSEGPLPGIPEEGAAAPDAWLGVFKSYNGGQSWTTTLLPGFPQDLSQEGSDSPLYSYSTACDPTVRAGSNGLFFYSGIAFDRIEHGRSAIFVARYIDNNTQAMGDMDSIKYLGVNIIDEGTSGQFADKPWIAIDAPMSVGDTVPIYTPGVGVQDIPRFNVYIVYSIFLGSESGGNHSKIMFARSTDCGISWERPIKLSESVHICQGTNIAVSPDDDGTIYITWRQYAREKQDVPHAIVMCKSDDSGNTFTRATVVATIDPFDQFTDVYRFRTSAFPALAADLNGLVYVAWSQRGVGPSGAARIVIKTSKDGINWEGPTTAVDNHTGVGHQIMPSLTYAGGKLIMTWYDTRKSPLYFESFIEGINQTMDAWVAQADTSSSSSDPPANPEFTDSTQASRYIYEANPPEIYQAQFNYPNFPMFVGGTAPFMGDYIDITPAPMFLYDDKNETWHFNTGEGDFDPTLCHITFACNRDVVPPDEDPEPPLAWTNYHAPIPPCDNETTGRRDQNIYTAPITQGILVGSPANTKPLFPYKSSFLVFVKNLADYPKLIRLTIDAPDGMPVSFWETFPDDNGGTPPPAECPFLHCGDTDVDVLVLPHSSITLTVFVLPYKPFDTTFRVNVEEIDGAGNQTGFQSSIVLNPDPVNTQIITPAEEYHTPLIISEDPADVELSDPNMLSAEIYAPYLEDLLNFSNPDIAAPGLRHPGLRHDTIINPGLRHTAVGDITDGQVTDLRWRVTNDSSTTSAYSFDAIGETPSVPHQLLIYRVATTPISYKNCQLSEEEHHELLLAIENPGLRHPGLRHPGLRHPGLRHNTFFLAPGEEAVITLRLIDPNPSLEPEGTLQGPQTLNSSGTLGGSFDPQFYAKTVAGAAIPQATDPYGNYEVANFMWIYTTTLPDGSVNDFYPDTLLEAEGGTGPYTWRLVEGYENLPPGLQLDSDGRIWDTPTYHDYPDVTYPKTYNFAVQATDNDTREIAYRSLSIRVILKTHYIEASAGVGGSIVPSGPKEVFHGDDQTFDITPNTNGCFHVLDVIVDKDTELEDHLGPVTTHTFTDVRADHTIHAVFERDTFTITASASDGGSIDPAGEVIVDCGTDKTFTITPEEGFRVLYVIVDEGKEWEDNLGPVTIHPFANVRADHTIHAAFGWVRRYNNDSVNGNDEASDIAVNDSGNVYVTGYSLGSPTGDDYYTLRYNSLGTEGLKARYDGPAHEGDRATAIAVDNYGNVYVTGYSYRGMPQKHSDYCTVKYDSSGNEAWDVRYDARRNGMDLATAITLDQSENYVYITGRSQDSESKKSDVLHYDYYTIKYNASTGRTQQGWEARYNNDSENGHDEATAIAVYEDPSGKVSVYVTGRSKGDGTDFDYVTIKYDANLKNPIVKRYDNVNGIDEATAIAVDSAGNVYVTGRSEGNGSGFGYLTIKYDADLKNPIVKRYDNVNGIDEATAIAVDSAGNVYVTGRSEGDGKGFDYVTIKYNNNLENQTVKRYNNDSVDGTDEATAIVVDLSSNFYVTGKSKGDGTGFDYCTIKYDSSGNVVWIDRYNNYPVNGDDEATAIAIDIPSGYVYITGKSKGNGTGFDFATIQFKQ